VLLAIAAYGGVQDAGPALQPGNAAACFTQVAICASSSASPSWMSADLASGVAVADILRWELRTDRKRPMFDLIEVKEGPANDAI
jgi:hypothetical protein